MKDKKKKMHWPIIVPEILWAELGLQELEELLSPHGVFQDLVDAKSPPLDSLLAGLLTARQGGKGYG